MMRMMVPMDTDGVPSITWPASAGHHGSNLCSGDWFHTHEGDDLSWPGIHRGARSKGSNTSGTMTWRSAGWLTNEKRKKRLNKFPKRGCLDRRDASPTIKEDQNNDSLAHPWVHHQRLHVDAHVHDLGNDGVVQSFCLLAII